MSTNVIALNRKQSVCDSCHWGDICALQFLNEDERRSVLSRPACGPTLHRCDHLFRQGEHGNALYVLRSGCLKEYVIRADGWEQITRFYFPGELVGLHA